MIFLRSLAFNIYFILLTFFVAFCLWPITLFKPVAFWPSRFWAFFTKLGLKYICNITHKIEGSDNIIWDSHAVYISKHQSAWETVMFYLFCHKPAFVLKKELMYIPFVNIFFITLDMIIVDRGAGAKSLKKLILDAKLRIAAKRQIVIFPEGTRVNYGEKGRLNPGVYSMYKEIETSFIPVAIDSGKCWGKNAFFKYPGVITVKFNPKIPANLSKNEFMQHVEIGINSL